MNSWSVIESPCIKVCQIETTTGWCLGCGRSLREIAAWTSYTETERARVGEDLPRRMKLMEGVPYDSQSRRRV